MHNTQATPSNGLWLMIAAASLWGTIGVATQAIYTLDTTTSLFINLARMLVAAPILLILCWRTLGWQMFSARPRDMALMILSGVLLATSHASYFAAIRNIGVSIATLLTICIAPLVVTGLAVLLKRERLTKRISLALACALIGSVLMVGLQSPDEAHTGLLQGVVYALTAAGSYGCVILCGRQLADAYHPLQVTAINFAAGTVVLLVINLISGMVIIQTVPGWLLVVYLGLIPTALAYGLFQMGMRSVSATAASIINMLEPLVAALLAWLLLGETLAAASVIGGTLLIFSLALLSTDKSQ